MTVTVKLVEPFLHGGHSNFVVQLFFYRVFCIVIKRDLKTQYIVERRSWMSFWVAAVLSWLGIEMMKGDDINKSISISFRFCG